MIVQGFWHGPIGPMERMCVNSYMRQGHQFHLYTYKPKEADCEAEIFDANEICPEDQIALFPWASIFSDYFRQALLAKKSGWWVDMDTICLKPFDELAARYVFASDNINQFYISGCFMYANNPPDFMRHCRDLIAAMTPEQLKKMGHMDIGPYLLQREVPKANLLQYVAKPHVFDPIPWDFITHIVDPAWSFDLSNAYAIHLRQSIWNEGVNSCAGILPNGKKLMVADQYDPECLWEKLKKELL